MRNYFLNTDKLVNRLVPHFMGGRNFILYIQNLLSPIYNDSNTFNTWAKEMIVEAKMTSQVIMLEKFLNNKFSKYFANSDERIYISDQTSLGVPIYYQSVTGAPKTVLYYISENKDKTSFSLASERSSKQNAYSFTVNCPLPNTYQISLEQMSIMITAYVERYRIAGKTFTIIYPQTNNAGE